MYTLTKPLTLEEAKAAAQQQANETGQPVTIYEMKEHQTVQPEYIKGLWYYGYNFERTWICRFEELSGFKFIFNECYDNKNKSKHKDWCLVDLIKGLATPEQIEAHLIAAAKAKGLVEGVEVVDVDGDVGLVGRLYANEDYLISDRRGNLLCLYNGSGTWATLASEAQTEAQQKHLIIRYTNEKGEQVEVKGTNVQVI